MRQESVDELLSVYIEAYTTCLPAGTVCRFTEEELKEEYMSMKTYSRAYAAMVLPLTMSEGFQYDDKDTPEEGARKHKKMIFDTLTQNENAARRYFDMLLDWGFMNFLNSCYLYNYKVYIYYLFYVFTCFFRAISLTLYRQSFSWIYEACLILMK